MSTLTIDGLLFLKGFTEFFLTGFIYFYDCVLPKWADLWDVSVSWRFEMLFFPAAADASIILGLSFIKNVGTTELPYDTPIGVIELE